MFVLPNPISPLIAPKKKPTGLSSLFSVLAIVALPWTSFSICAEELDRIVAIVEMDVVMQSEVNEQTDRVKFQMQQQATRMPPNAVLQRQVMERLVLEKIQLQYAEQVKIEVGDDVLKLAIMDMAKQNNLNLEQFKEVLASENYQFDVFKEQIRQEIIISKLRKTEVDNKIRVRETEIDNYLRNESNTAELQEYRISHILISVPSEADNKQIQKARKKTEEALGLIETGDDFGEVAISVSDGQQALEGGDLGWRKGSQVPGLFADSISALKVGENSGIITNASGFHIIQLTDKRNLEEFMIPQYKTRHILISPNELLPMEQVANRISNLKKRFDLEGDDNFAQIARTNSDDRTSALQGGDLGWVSEGEMVPEFEEIMTAIDIGMVSPPFESEFGFHILQVTEKRNFDGTEAIRRDRGRRAIRQQKLDERRQYWLRRLRDEAYVEHRNN
jgi:peptidyl-prolyl cis-trans isomerase SurA